MDDQTLFDELTADTATFIATMCYRNMSDMHTDMLNHDGHVVFARPDKRDGTHALWRALHEAIVEGDTDILVVSPNPAGAKGAILIIEDELDRAPFAPDVWGVEQSSQTQISFGNGSRIKSVHAGDGDGDKRLRGYRPDLLIVDNWEEENYQIDETVMAETLLPMFQTGEVDVWINDIEVGDDPLTRAVLRDGAYVMSLDQR